MDELQGYLTKLASAEPTPGGGSAAMVSAALSCALTAMVARIAKDDALAQRADALRERTATLREADEAAFAAVVAAKGDREATQRALHGAAEAPLNAAAACVEALDLAAQALALGNKHLVSDVGCANEFAHAALNACAYNVRINHKYMEDAGAIASQAQRLESLENDSQALYRRTASNTKLGQ